MANLLNISGPLLLLLVAALLAACARADVVTTDWCAERGTPGRVRQYPDSKATQLFMDGCHLSKMNNLEFMNAPNLITIDLSANEIPDFDPDTFSPVPTLTTLWLNANWLRELPVFAEHSCPRLNMVDFSDNRLTAIKHAETFSACAQIQKLYLSKNQIEYLHPSVFSHLPELSVLILSKNKIRFIPNQLFARNNKIVELRLENNLITHLPPKITSYFKQTNANVFLSFHTNPWNCACLNEVLADVKRSRKHIILDHYDGGRPECKHIDMVKYPCRQIRELGAVLDISSFLPTGRF